MTGTLERLPDEALVPVEREETDIIRLAILKNMDADSITKLVALVEGRERQAAERAFSDDMRGCQDAIPVVVRNKENKGTHSWYANLDGILPAVKPVASRFGFALSFAEADCPLEGWKRTVCDVRHRGGHSVRYHVDLPLDGKSAQGKDLAMNPVQAATSTGTYGQRVLVCRIFNLTIADSDVDGQSMADLLVLNEKQRAELNDLIEQGNIPVDKLLKWIKAESLDTITQKQFEKITTTYRQRKAGAA